MADEEEGEEEKEAEMGVERRCWGWFSHLVMEVQKLVCSRGMNSGFEDKKSKSGEVDFLIEGKKTTKLESGNFKTICRATNKCKLLAI